MKKLNIPYEKVGQLNARDLAYLKSEQALRPFYNLPPDKDSFHKMIEQRKSFSVDRKTLHAVLKDQYQGIHTSELVGKNLEHIGKENSFTITTGHQPNLATGPVYFLYKIIGVINLAEELARDHPGYHFIPLYWMGSEDHDFAEINHFHLFGNRFEWQESAGGPVGQLSTSGLAPILLEIKMKLGESETGKTAYRLLEEAYTQNENLEQATFSLVDSLFSSFGLIILIPSDARLKRQFIPIMEKELLSRRSAEIVEKTIDELAAAGYKGQASPREINLFYTGKQFRERIVEEDGKYKVLNQNLTFTEKEILEELNAHPERFSPNVILRPAYQELILPNLAYVGGGGEIAYWLERKKLFEYLNLSFPILIRRNSVLVIDKISRKKLEKIGMDTASIFKDTEDLIKEYVLQNSSHTISLKEEKQKISEILGDIVERTLQVDPSLKKTVLATEANLINEIESLENKLLKAEKQQHDIALDQIRGLKEKLFPANGLQERHENFLSFYVRWGEEFILALKKNLDPLEKGFVVLVEEG